MSPRRNGFLLAADLHPEHHYARERLPAIVAALERLGARHRIVDLYDFGLPGDRDALRDLPAHGRAAWFARHDPADLCERLARHVRAFDPETVLLFTVSDFCNFLLPSALERWRGEGRRTVGVFGDDEWMFDHHLHWVPLFDVSVAYTEAETARYRAAGADARLLPVGFTPLPAPRLAELSAIAPDRDLLFVGKPYGNRARLLERVVRAGLPLDLYGSRAWLDHPALAPHYRGFLPNALYDETVRRHRIHLGLMEDSVTGRPHINAKVFDAAKTGAFSIVTNYAPFRTTYGLTEGESVVTYRDGDDLVAKARRYLADDAARERIAREGARILAERADYRRLYFDLFAGLAGPASRAPEHGAEQVASIRPLGRSRLRILLRGRETVVSRRAFLRAPSAHLDGAAYVRYAPSGGRLSPSFARCAGFLAALCPAPALACAARAGGRAHAPVSALVETGCALFRSEAFVERLLARGLPGPVLFREPGIASCPVPWLSYDRPGAAFALPRLAARARALRDRLRRLGVPR